MVANLIPRLADRRAVVHLAINQTADSTGLHGTVAGNPHPGDPFAVRRLAEIARRLRPTVLVVADLAAMPRYAAALRMLAGVRRLAHCPVDGHILEPKLVGWATPEWRLVVHTQWARREVVSAWSRLEGQAADPQVHVIGHGVDERFRALPTLGREPSRTRARGQLGLDAPGDEVVMLVVGRNQPRKRLDLAIEVFARLAADSVRPVRLCLRTDSGGVGGSVLASVEAAGVHRLLVAPGHAHALTGRLPPHALNLLYNACEVGLNTSVGESWGLASFEHGATGAAQVLPDSGVAAELWGDTALRIPTTRNHPIGPTMLGRLIDPVAAARACRLLVDHPTRLDDSGIRAREWATRPQISWDTVAERWHEVLDDVEAEPHQIGP